MSFRLLGLEPGHFEHLLGLSDEGLKRYGALRRIADVKPGFPCRVSLEDAKPGESGLLLNYEHLSVDTPFRSSHAIYVREEAAERFDAVDTIPDALRRRVLSLRAFDAPGMMLDAAVVNGAQAEAEIERMVALRDVAFLHVHYAGAGCYAARAQRA